MNEELIVSFATGVESLVDVGVETELASELVGRYCFDYDGTAVIETWRVRMWLHHMYEMKKETSGS